MNHPHTALADRLEQRVATDPGAERQLLGWLYGALVLRNGGPMERVRVRSIRHGRSVAMIPDASDECPVASEVMEHEALVLVHGCGTDAHFWDELTPCLSGLSVIALSLPGRGETGGEALTSASEAARWLLERLRERSVRRAIVVGHSFGGAIALETVMHTPQAGDPVVTGLGLVCTGARLRVLPAILEAVTAAAQTGVVADIGRLAYHRDTDPELIERVEAKARHTPTATTMHDWLATHAFDRLGQLGSIDVPTWVVCGSEDGLTPPKYGRYLAEQISGARLELIEGAGHMLPVERPAELAQALQMLIEASVATPAMPGEAS